MTFFSDPSGDFQKESVNYQNMFPKMPRHQVRQEVLGKAQVCLDDLNKVCLERGETDFTQAKRAYYRSFLAEGK